MKTALLAFTWVISIQLNAQSIKEELEKLDWPKGWGYTLDTNNANPLKKDCSGRFIISSDSIADYFYVYERNVENDSCSFVLSNSKNDSLYPSSFGDAYMGYVSQSSCFYNIDFPPLRNFLWKNFMFISNLCPCIPNKNRHCKSLEAILVKLFDYKPISPFKFNPELINEK